MKTGYRAECVKITKAYTPPEYRGEKPYVAHIEIYGPGARMDDGRFHVCRTRKGIKRFARRQATSEGMRVKFLN